MNKTVIDFIELHASQRPDALAVRYLVDGEDKMITLTYSDIRNRALTLSRILREKVGENSVALLLYSPGVDFIIAFLACLYAGIIAVPTYPPIPRRLNSDIFRLELICQDAKPKVILTDYFASKLLSMSVLKENCKSLIDKLISLGRSKQNDLMLSKIPYMITEGLKSKIKYDTPLNPLKSDNIAFIQYSSGSTGHPKGIIVSQDNLTANIRAMIKMSKANLKSVGVSWLPHYHDMGLIGFILVFLVAGANVTYLSPLSFLENPLRWLKAIDKYKGTLTGGPNFGFELCIKHIQKHPNIALNLSSLNIAICGAEPINPEMPERFYEAFKQYGFKKEMFFPVYGLAENTLLVSSGINGDLPIVKQFNTDKLLQQHRAVENLNESNEGKSTRFISCGTVIENHVLRIVDSRTKSVLETGQLGEIWLKGPSIAKGYWNKPDITKETFDAYTTNGEGPFLRTGDMGFLIDNNLYIYGRIKDIIIINAKKYAPQDLEFTVQYAHESIRKGNVAAFSVNTNSQDHLVVVAEVSNRSKNFNAEQVFASIIKNIATDFEIPILEIVLIKPKSILKTTSGKIQRQATKKAYLEKQLYEVATWRSPNITQPAGIEQMSKD